MGSTTMSTTKGIHQTLSPIKCCIHIRRGQTRSSRYRKTFDYSSIGCFLLSAFDVEVHKNLLKKLYHLGIQDKHWTLIKSLHTNASSAIKFNGLVSENFNILQGGPVKGNTKC